MKNRFDLIIFDWDGTLVDSIDWIVHCMKMAARETGCVVPEDSEVKNIIGLSIQKALETIFPDKDENIKEQMIACYSQEFFSKQITENDLFLGVKDMLLEFKRSGYQLAVATGKSQASLNKAIQGTGLNGFFHTTRCADQTTSKPSPQMIEEIIQEMGVAKERVLMVGDSVHDMQMAKNAEVLVVAVSCGANSQTELNKHNPLLSLQQTIELLEVL